MPKCEDGVDSQQGQNHANAAETNERTHMGTASSIAEELHNDEVDKYHRPEERIYYVHEPCVGGWRFERNDARDVKDVEHYQSDFCSQEQGREGFRPTQTVQATQVPFDSGWLLFFSNAISRSSQHLTD